MAKKMKKTPMGLDENGNSIWVDTPTVTIPDEFDIHVNLFNFSGGNFRMARASEYGWAGSDIGYKSQGGKMWENVTETTDDERIVLFLAVNPDGRFAGEVEVYNDEIDFSDFNSEFEGQTSDMNAIVPNFERFVNDVLPQIYDRLEEEIANYNASTKKSTPDVKMSFTENVNKMRVNNYAKTGNINTVMKENKR